MEDMVNIKSDYLFDNVYNNKTVLVTGHTGFKGSWLSIWLEMLGAKVIGYGLNPINAYDNFNVTKIYNKITDIRGDIRDTKKLDEVFKKYNPDIVFHLAAQPLVRLSYEIPKETYEINVIGTLNVLDCIRKFDSVKVGIMITTDKCYENKEQLWGYRENDSIGGFDPYSSSKGCAEILISSYRNSYMNPKNYLKHGKALSSVRAGNVIGGGDWAKDRIIPDCIQALINNKPIELRNPKAVRPWQHVLEPLSGYLLLGAKMYKDGTNYSGAWNFGPPIIELITVQDIVNCIIENWGTGTSIDISKKDDLYESNILTLDCTKAQILLDWKPKLDYKKAIAYTVEWYKNYKSTDAYNLCINQIKEYSK